MKQIHILFFFSLYALFLFPWEARSQTVGTDPVLPDSIDEGALLHGDSSHAVHHNTASGLNAREYILEGRYKSKEETFTRHLLDHVYVEGGLAGERIAPVDAGYSYGRLDGIRLAVGKDLSPLSSVRLSLQAESGYQDDFYYTFVKYHGRLDYLFNLSNYFTGYHSSRQLNISAVFGLGMAHSQNNYSKASSISGDVHTGIQLKLFTGSHAFLALEPYIGIAGDGVDVSGNRNWRKYDFLYGMYVSYIYYLRNNLSPEMQRLRLSPRYRRDDGVGNAPPSWWKPWFVEYNMGIAFNPSSTLSFMASRGSSSSISIGRWLSPVIGVRGSLFMRSTFWNKEYDSSILYNDMPSVANYAVVYAGGRFDMLINPWGLSKRFSWNRPFSGWMLLGIEGGKMKKTQTGTPFYHWVHGISAGVHLACRLTDNLQLFLEPRYAWTQYHVPYNNVDWYKKYLDRNISVEAGVSVIMVPKKYQRDESADFFMRRLQNIRIGVFGGTNFLFKYSPTYDNAKAMGYNFGGYAEWRLNYISGVRLGYEQVRLSYASPVYYDDVYQDASSMLLSHSRHGLWDHSYNLGVYSLSYQMDVLSAFATSSQRHFTVESFLGIAVANKAHLSATINSNERLEEGHTAIYTPKQEDTKIRFGAVFGCSLVGHVTSHVDLILTSSNYFIHNLMPSGLVLPHVFGYSLLSTLNVGVRCNLSLKQLFKRKKEWL